MDYTQIISAVIALISALVSAFLIPWLKTKIDANKLQTIKTYVEIGVKAAEQLYAATDGRIINTIRIIVGVGITAFITVADQRYPFAENVKSDIAVGPAEQFLFII